jgi:peptidoglycan-associated lipoprotein
MKTRSLKICIPLALALAAGCATQSKNEAADSSGAQSSTASASQPSANSSGTMQRGVRGRIARDAAGKPTTRSVYYDFDQATITAQDSKVIEANADYLRQHPELKVRVEGNADERGSKEYNLALGQRRAESVAKRMGLLGIKEDRVEAVSYGEEKPKVAGHDEKAWSENRRSDIQY